ncbi:AAA family ATPase [Candidatus Nomurabacteria bacterium]|nr:AAA family ATPase [Candidatus Nomurabacteria bacterium]
MKSKYRKITIGGLSGTGKGTISKMLAEKIGFTRASVGDFAREMAKEEGMTIFQFDQKHQNDEEAGKKLDLILDQRTEDFGRENTNFVFEGRLPAHFIKDAFKILLTCQDEERARRIGQRDETSAEDSLKEALEREALLRDRYQIAYNLADFDDPKYYDFVIDTTNITPDQIVEKIISQIT